MNSDYQVTFSSFQKGSPFIQDVNRLIGLSGQMGMMDVTAFLANSTKCDTWSEIKASHKGPHINDVCTIGNKKGVIRRQEEFHISR